MTRELTKNTKYRADPDQIDLELSIVMPCLNEAETLAICIEKAQHYLMQHEISGEIIVADNGSIDGSQAIAARMGARVIAVQQKGYGNALIGGIAVAQGEFVIMGDADDSYDFSALNAFVRQLRSGYDLVIGNRFQGGIAVGAMPFLHQYLGNPVLTGIGRLFFNSPCGDFYCGLRGFRREAIAALDLRTTGMEFALEMIVKASLYNLQITEVPTTLSPDGRSRPPHLRTWRDGWRSLRFLLLYSPRWLFFYPGLGLMSLGFISTILLLSYPKVHTLLYSAVSIVIGFQILSFAILTKVFAVSEGLLPIDRKVQWILQHLNLEKGLISGIGFIFLGAVLTFAALSIWWQRSFGDLDPLIVMRIVVPGAISFALGFQIICTSFFLSVLQLKRR